jgi:hypothetical protein
MIERAVISLQHHQTGAGAAVGAVGLERRHYLPSVAAA